MKFNNYKKAYSKIKKAQNILLVTHNRPDGDALSSITALMDLLISENKNFFAYCYDKPPFQFNFLPHIEKISNNKENLQFDKYDLIISLDCGGLNRTQLAKEISQRRSDQIYINIDHHPRLDNYEDINLKFPEASSTAEVIYNFFRINHIKINKNIANCILTGILTDTGNFLYPATSDETVKIASKMLIYGARFPIILENTWRNKSISAMKIWGKAMNNLQINKKYNIAYSILTLNDLRGEDVTEEELEGLSGFLSNLYGVNGLLYLREGDDGTLKGSLRTSHPDIDISKLAVKLGGGGHAKASGFMVKGKLTKNSQGWQIK